MTWIAVALGGALTGAVLNVAGQTLVGLLMIYVSYRALL